ncbi:MAG: hypothetical protein ACRDSR_19020 [Pseudonocardiaceae bacterium]
MLVACPDVERSDPRRTGDDLDQIRSAAADRGTSPQNYLRDVILAQAAYLRRHEALARTAERLGGRPEVPADERQAVLDAIAAGTVGGLAG